jgi:uncharacterized membrane protein
LGTREVISGALPLTALIAVATFLAFWLDHRFAALSKVGASLLALILGALISNAGIVPAASPVYDVIAGPVTMLAIAWLLLAVHLGDLKLAGPRMVGAFGIALVGTALGAFTGALLFAGALGGNTWRLAGTLTGTYSGGSLNFVAVGRGVGLPASLFAGATAADALLTGVWLAFTLMLPLWIGRFYPPVPDAAKAHPEGMEPGSKEDHHPFFVSVRLSTLDLARLLALGFVLLAAAELTGSGLEALAGRGFVPGWIGEIPSVLWLTTFALAVGHTKWFQRPAGAMQLGTLALHFFFVVIGIWSRVAEIVAVGPGVFFYTMVVVAVHGLFVFGVGRWAKIDAGTLSVASQAAVGGPSSALAVAVSREWPGLILPGIIVGLMGYAVGNYLGFGVAYLVRGLGIGL